ncbi:MAG: hypothetical protein FJ301_06765 [Planctomycetes bacterium]|nr:hypothetical protein [Planctomycetota bacterium]
MRQVVTEQGAVDVRDVGLRQRAAAPIGIAAPGDRERLGLGAREFRPPRPTTVAAWRMARAAGVGRRGACCDAPLPRGCDLVERAASCAVGALGAQSAAARRSVKRSRKARRPSFGSTIQWPAISAPSVDNVPRYRTAWPVISKTSSPLPASRTLVCVGPWWVWVKLTTRSFTSPSTTECSGNSARISTSLSRRAATVSMPNISRSSFCVPTSSVSASRIDPTNDWPRWDRRRVTPCLRPSCM